MHFSSIDISMHEPYTWGFLMKDVTSSNLEQGFKDQVIGKNLYAMEMYFGN